MNLRTLAEAVLPAPLFKRLSGSSIAKRLARGSFWGLISSLIIKGSALVQSIILARIMGVAGFGEWGIILSTISMVGVFASFGLGNTVTKFVAEWRVADKEKLGNLLGIQIIIAIIMGIAVLLFLTIFSSIIANQLLAAPQLDTALIIVGFIVMISAVSGVFNGILSGYEYFRLLTISQVLSTIVGVILTITFTVFFGVNGAIVGLLVTNSINFIILLFIVLPLISKNGVTLKFNGYREGWSIFINMSLPLTISSLLSVPAYWLANVALVQHPNGYEQMGGFQAANQWRTIMVFFPHQILYAYLPIVSSLINTSPKSIYLIQWRLSWVVLFSTIVIALPVILFSPWLMSLYGSEFSMFYMILIVMVIKGFFEALLSVFKRTMIAVGQLWLLLIPEAAFFLIVIFIGISWLIPEYLAFGLAITLMVAQVIQTVLQYFLTKYSFKIIINKLDFDNEK